MFIKAIAICCLAALPVLQAADSPAPSPSAPGFHERDPRYRLHVTDRLQLKYRYTPEYDQSLNIQPDGFATVNLIGDVKLEGLTLDQARSALIEKLGTRLNEPEITLTLEQYVMPSFIVAGQITNPGRYELHGPVTVVEGLALAGGLKDNAKTNNVILYRHVSPDMAETHLLNIKHMVSASHPHLEESVQLQPGDLLVVPQSTISKIEHLVKLVNFGTYVPIN